MATRKEQQSTVDEATLPRTFKAPKRRKHSEKAKLDLAVLLSETPDNCIDTQWESLPPTGRELP